MKKPVLIVIAGPNGSGKTNLGMAMFDIVNHLTQKFKKADYYKKRLPEELHSLIVELPAEKLESMAEK